MLIHDRFVFLHVPKTAGTFLRRVLHEEVPGCEPLPGMPGSAHYGWDQIPEEAADRPVLAFVRNPWDWYVSWYSFAVGQAPETFERRREQQPFFRWLFADGPPGSKDSAPHSANGANGANPFATTLRRACAGFAGGEEREELERLVGRFELARPLLEGHDFYTARLMVTVGEGFESERATIGRFESLMDDLESFFANSGVDLPDGAMARIRAAAPVGASDRRPYRAYYDAELRELVEASCGRLIERFGYGF